MVFSGIVSALISSSAFFTLHCNLLTPLVGIKKINDAVKDVDLRILLILDRTT